MPEDKKIDLVKHLAGDAKVSEFREKIGEKKFWELVIKTNAAEKKNAQTKKQKKN